MAELNGIRIEPGERFTTADGKKFEITKVQGDTVIVKNLEDGKHYAYGAGALRRLEAERWQNC